jgi:hypothetical protein
MRISLSDHRLSGGERRFLEQIASKLREPTPRQPLPESYRQALDEVCGEGEVDRRQ